MTIKNAFAAALIALIVLFSAGCGRKDIERRGPVRIAINTWPGYAHAFVAEKKGIFAKNGVSVELHLTQDINDSLEHYKNGDVDGIFEVFPDIIILNSKGYGARVVYISDYSDTGDVVIAGKGIRSMAGLKGKTVSFVGLNSFSHIFVIKALERSGIHESDVRTRIIPAQDVLDAIEKGRIDAGHTWEPVTSRALKKGYRIIARAGDFPGVITDVLAFRPETIEKRGNDVRNIVKSLSEARGFIMSNRAEGIRIMASAEGMTEAEMLEGVQGVVELGVEGNLKAMDRSSPNPSLYATGEAVSAFLLERGQLSQRPDLGWIIDPEFVSSLNSGAK